MANGKRESGEAMIEAVYVVIISMMIIFFVINVAVVYHNRIVVTAIADEAAGSVAEIYGSPRKEPFFNHTAPDYFARRNVYRYVLEGAVGSFFGHKAMTEEKGKWYASYLLYKNEFSTETEKNRKNFDDIQVTCKDEGGWGLATVTVEIERKYPVFILNPMSFFGLDLEYTVRASGSAVCYDPIYQMNSYAFTQELCEKADGLTPVTEILQDCLQIVEKLAKLFRD